MLDCLNFWFGGLLICLGVLIVLGALFISDILVLMWVGLMLNCISCWLVDVLSWLCLFWVFGFGGDLCIALIVGLLSGLFKCWVCLT